LPYIKQGCQSTCAYVAVVFPILWSQGKVGLNFSMICGGGANAEQIFSEEERTRSQKMRLRPSLQPGYRPTQ